ncbi:acetoacetyl-CoA synthase [Aspergillus saccharolyticus JOP 1030-1]|uniref:Acetoacetyl-coenzyme A synthetase n=1 Tax=Aspergillus saccharolyticus JOP 1030-1 TaxID=1450539 RepID=A0A318ZYP3_9EURO|nr:acetoacetyl-coenzyme A synthetase [Aspergillus saccharolyticus JOP 1030-1]PYH49320.1 acetoacetyl-coenzyme A synthetase [Aspergillus saccharolyticus JOP 1030-1]
MTAHSFPRKLWEHSHPESTSMGRFHRAWEQELGRSMPTFHDLYHHSITHRAAFWDFCWRYFNILHQGTYTSVVDESARIDTIPHWFQGIQLNYAENILFSGYGSVASTVGKEDDKVAVTEVREGGHKEASHITWGKLRRRTGRLVQAMKAHGVRKGDRIAACASNSLDTLLVFLATTALGGIFSSSSTDMGVKGILDRLRQIKPRWLFMDDQAFYNGKALDLRPKMREIVEGMQGIPEFSGIVAQPRFVSHPADVSSLARTLPLAVWEGLAIGDTLVFEQVEFRDPFLIVYSSGTTGQPKCIMHSVGGVLLNAYKELVLHHEMDAESVGLQYTTTGWIMYISMINTLLFGGRTILYDGSPFLPEVATLIRLVEQERVTHLGISPRYLLELQRAQVRPRDIADISSLKLVTSTGMVLPEALFEWFYDSGFPRPVRLNNISGGTDIAGCFGVSNPLLPVYAGGCAGMSLGVAVEVYDSTIEGENVAGVPVPLGTAGDLVATKAFPNVPIGFWGPDGAERFHNAYFNRFKGVWTHGDFVSIHPGTRQLLFHGRADGVLNPSGVRFGSAEIYQVIEDEFAAEVVDSICVGQRRPSDPDERVILFLLLKPGVECTQDLVQRIKAAIRQKLSPRHVPAFIFPTPEIPTTVNGKKVELPVKQIVSGKVIKPSGTLLNPQSLDYYYRFAKDDALEGGKRGSKL